MSQSTRMILALAGTALLASAVGLLAHHFLDSPFARSAVTVLVPLAAVLAFSVLLARRDAGVGRAAHEEEKFRLVVESSPNGIVMVDGDGVVRLVNREIERLFGYSRGELLGRSMEILVPERFRAHHPRLREGYSANPAPRTMGAGRDLYGQRKDGTEFPIEVGLNPIETPEGMMVLSVIVDITERKRSDEKFRLVVESSPNGIVMVDGEGTIQLVNAETERLFGHSREELVGKSMERLVPERFRDHHPQLRAAYTGAPAGRAMGEGRDLFGLRKDGMEFPIEVGLNPIQTPEGMMVLSVIVDITERKRAEGEIRKYTEDLKRSNEELETFAYAASHDLQEPLRMVASYVELLANRYRGQLDEKADKYIFYAVDGATRMKLLINDLLAYSRVSTQGRSFEPTDSGAVVETVMRSLKGLAQETGAVVEWGDLPMVMADPIQLGQVFQNLIGNGIKFRGEAPPQVRIDAAVQGRFWQFEVRDNGIGIDAKYSERVFQMFQRLNAREQYGGTGIGLAVAQKIVQRHGGAIWFTSEPGHGTIFHFTIPRV